MEGRELTARERGGVEPLRPQKSMPFAEGRQPTPRALVIFIGLGQLLG
jgi:hypothetical protein